MQGAMDTVVNEKKLELSLNRTFNTRERQMDACIVILGGRK